MKDKIGALTKEEFDRATKDEIWFLVSNLVEDRNRYKKENEDLKAKIAELRELRRLATAVKYSPSSEQLYLFLPEIELYTKAVDEEVETVHVEGYDKKKPKKDVASLPADTPVEVIDHTEDAPETKIIDGVEYVRGEDRVVDQIAYIPAKWIVERHIWATYVNEKEETEVEYDNKKVDTLSCSPSFIAHTAVAKFDDQIPYYRQQEMLARDGLKITRQNMAIWMVKYYEVLLPMEKLIRKRIYQSPLIHKDETPVQVLDFRSESGRPSTNTFMHVTVGSSWDRKEGRWHRLVIFECKRGRTIDTLLEEIRAEGFDGYILTDGLKGYEHYNEKKHCGCWVHAIRRFKNILKSNKEDKLAQEVCLKTARIFQIENVWREKLANGEIAEEEFLLRRKEESLPLIKEIYTCLESKQLLYAPKSLTGKAIDYILSRKEQLVNYLEIVEGVPDGSVAERAIRGFAMGRRNWLFCQSCDGADASAFFYSLIENAKLCGLNPEDYMEAVCTFGPRCKSDEEFERLLPWNIDLTEVSTLRENRFKAKPIPGNSKPFKLSGAHG